MEERKDTISRQAAIDAILHLTNQDSVRGQYEFVKKHGLEKMWSGGIVDAIDAVIAVPPAQPDLQPIATDCISRQDAIDIFDDYNVSVENGELEAYSRDRKRLCDLPSAQPEIIGCKDCQHRGDEPIADGRYWCKLHGTFMYYCSDAERRPDERVN